MLILTRKEGEEICIGDDIVIKFLGGYGYQGRIGIEAPKDIPVHRREIYDMINRKSSIENFQKKGIKK